GLSVTVAGFLSKCRMVWDFRVRILRFVGTRFFGGPAGGRSSLARGRSPRGGLGRWRPLTYRLMIANSDHHPDDFRLLGCDDLARRLRPVHIVARIVAN